MSTTSPENSNLSDQARRNLWMHFSRMGTYETHEVPVIVRGEGAYVWDQHGKRYLDGLAGLFTSQLGHGRMELAEAGAKQAGTLAYFPLWTYAHPRAVELAERVASLTPGDLNRVFFTTGGSGAVESAWKLARQYFRIMGQPQRTKVISRSIAYHGTSMGVAVLAFAPQAQLVDGASKPRAGHDVLQGLPSRLMKEHVIGDDGGHAGGQGEVGQVMQPFRVARAIAPGQRQIGVVAVGLFQPLEPQGAQVVGLDRDQGGS
jgi:4-aminobutyrate aminotransferase-like enzyme